MEKKEELGLVTMRMWDLSGLEGLRETAVSGGRRQLLAKALGQEQACVCEDALWCLEMGL